MEFNIKFIESQHLDYEINDKFSLNLFRLTTAHFSYYNV